MKRGKRLFEQAGCAECHSGPYHTDMKKYDLGHGKDLDKDLAFDTPALVEVWRTAPYLYDGRAATIRELLTTHNRMDRHGKTSTLTPEEIDALAAFVLSL
jgi:cytochrome c peroxidase